MNSRSESPSSLKTEPPLVQPPNVPREPENFLDEVLFASVDIPLVHHPLVPEGTVGGLPRANEEEQNAGNANRIFQTGTTEVLRIIAEREYALKRRTEY